MSLGRVQSNAAFSAGLSNTSSINVALTGVTAGNALLALWGGSTTGAHGDTATLSDNVNAGNYANDVTNGTVGNFLCGISSKFNVGGGSTTITFAITPTAQPQFLLVMEVSGLLTASAFDVGSNNFNSTITTAVNSGTTATTAQASEFAVAVGIDSNAITWSPGSGWTMDANATNGFDGRLGAEYQVLTSTQAVTGTFTLGTSVLWQCCVATYKAAGAATPSNAPILYHRKNVLIYV